MEYNEYYQKIRKYAQKALNGDLKTYLAGRSKYTYGTIDLSQYVKESVFEETVGNLNEKIDSEIEERKTADDLLNNSLDNLESRVEKNEDNISILEDDVTDLNNDITDLLNTKLDNLTAGTGLAIEDNVISCTIDHTISKVVTLLPDAPDEEDKNKIFLVPSSEPGEDNIYIEYLYVNGSWEEIGRFKADTDLSNYYDKDEVDKLLDEKGGVTSVNTTIDSPLNLEASISNHELSINANIDEASTTSNGYVTAEAYTDWYNLYDNIMIAAAVGREEEDEVCLISPSAVKEGLYSNYTKYGVVVIQDNKLFVIALTESEKIPWSSGYKLFNTACTSAKEAVVDSDGESNTDNIIAASSEECITNTSDYAAGFCNNYANGMFPAGSWYLPSMYELLVIRSHIREINYALNLIGGTPIRYGYNISGNGYWASTEHGSETAWQINMHESHLVSANKVSTSYYVRPITTLNKINSGGAGYSITVEEYDYEGSTELPAAGGTYSPNIKVLLTSTTSTRYLDPSEYSTTFTDRSSSYTCTVSHTLSTRTGELTVEENTSYNMTREGLILACTVTYVDPNGDSLTAGKLTTFTQVPPTVVSATIDYVTTPTYDDIPYEGGTVYPLYSGDEYNISVTYETGTTTTINYGALVHLYVALTGSIGTLDSDTGAVSASLNVSSSQRAIATVQQLVQFQSGSTILTKSSDYVTIMLEGLETVSITCVANTPTFANVPAEGGSVTAEWDGDMYSIITTYSNGSTTETHEGATMLTMAYEDWAYSSPSILYSVTGATINGQGVEEGKITILTPSYRAKSRELCYPVFRVVYTDIDGNTQVAESDPAIIYQDGATSGLVINYFYYNDENPITAGTYEPLIQVVYREGMVALIVTGDCILTYTKISADNCDVASDGTVTCPGNDESICVVQVEVTYSPSLSERYTATDFYIINKQ